jgi:late competence protein required for DNA uptake (superfamily II DNA/RNA helicase)
MRCKRCGEEISEEESRTYLGEILCDDCYLDARVAAKACDPWAVYTATKERVDSGLVGAEGLTKLQEAIYGFIKDKGKVTAVELVEKFNLPRGELEIQFAVLRHCELIRGCKEGNKIYIIPFD